MYTKELWEEWELQIPPSRSLSFTCAALIPLWNGAFGQEHGDEIIDDLNSLLSWWCECLQPLLGARFKRQSVKLFASERNFLGGEEAAGAAPGNIWD